MPSQGWQAESRSSRYRRHGQKQVVVQVVASESPDVTRVDRLATLLSEALSRRLGQDPSKQLNCSSLPLDYPPVVSPTNRAKSAVPTEEE